MKKQIKNGLSIFFATAAFAFSSAQAFSQSHVSTQGHDGKVTAVFSAGTATINDNSFYTADNNGFIVKWTSDGLGEHYQISNYKIELIAKNPNSGNIAIYETDGYSKYRVSVIDWKNFSRKFTKYFNTPVSALNFSEKGALLLVGTADVGGTYIYDAATGRLRKQLSDAPGAINLIQSSPSEKNLILYSSTGNIVYYDLSNYQIKKKITTERTLKQSVIFGVDNRTNCFLAGVKDNVIYIINAMTGKTIGRFTVSKPYIFVSKAKDEAGLYYVAPSGKNYEVKLIDNVMLETLFTAKTTKIDNPMPTQLIKIFSGIASGETISAGAKNNKNIVLGTSQGNIYTITDVISTEPEYISAITDKMYEKITDIAAGQRDFYMLTASGLFMSSFEKKNIIKVASNTGHSNILKYNNNLILWSKNTLKPVQILNLDAQEQGIVTLFNPKNDIDKIHVYQDKIVTVQGNSIVDVYDMSGNNLYTYTATSIEDAMIVNETDLYIAKTKLSKNDAPLMYINLNTKETLSLDVEAQVAYSLSFNPERNSNHLYGVLITNKDSGVITSIFDFDLTKKSLRTVYSTSDENSDVFTYLYNETIYSNIGNSQLYSINLSNNRTTLYRRSASIPSKVQATADRLAVLNKDGSISWYNSNMQTVLSDWYMAIDGSWYEF